MSDSTSIFTVRVPLAFRKRGGRKMVVAPEVGTMVVPTRADPTLVKALARAFRWRKVLENGRYATIDDLAAGEKINPSYVSRVLRLTLLAPEIVESILDGRQRAEITLPALMEPFPMVWADQGERLGCAVPRASLPNAESQG